MKPILSTMWSAEEDLLWDSMVEVIGANRPGRPRDLLALWRASRGKEALILRGSVTLGDAYRDLVFAMLLQLRRERQRVLMSDATWERLSRSLTERLPKPLHSLVPMAITLFITAMDHRDIRYGVLSSDELQSLPDTWSIDRERVVFTPFASTVHEMRSHDPPLEVRDDGYLFAGGNSLRDYPLLMRAVSGTGLPLFAATSWRPAASPPDVLSPGVTVAEVPHEDFLRLMAASRAVVITLQPATRSAGQQTYLNAMALRKPVIATEAPGVRDYITHGETGIIVPRDHRALRAALRHVMDPANSELYEKIGWQACQQAQSHYSHIAYKRRLLHAAGFDESRLEQLERRLCG